MNRGNVTQTTDNSSFNPLTSLITPVLFLMFSHLDVKQQVFSAIRENPLHGFVANITADLSESEIQFF